MHVDPGRVLEVPLRCITCRYERAATKSSLYDRYLQQQRLPKPQLPAFVQAQANGSPAELGYLAGMPFP